MKSDLESIPGISAFVRRKLDNGELVFAVKDALEIIQSCGSSGIAVLGIETFPGLNVSTYELGVGSPHGIGDWPDYIKLNTRLAEEFIRRQIEGEPESDCVLTTASWREFCKLHLH